MQQWNKGQADQRGIENLGPWILSLTASDQSKSQIFFLSFSFFYMTKGPYFCTVDLQGTDRVDD